MNYVVPPWLFVRRVGRQDLERKVFHPQRTIERRLTIHLTSSIPHRGRHKILNRNPVSVWLVYTCKRGGRARMWYSKKGQTERRDGCSNTRGHCTKVPMKGECCLIATRSERFDRPRLVLAVSRPSPSHHLFFRRVLLVTLQEETRESREAKKEEEG